MLTHPAQHLQVTATLRLMLRASRRPGRTRKDTQCTQTLIASSLRSQPAWVDHANASRHHDSRTACASRDTDATRPSPAARSAPSRLLLPATRGAPLDTPRRRPVISAAPGPRPSTRRVRHAAALAPPTDRHRLRARRPGRTACRRSRRGHHAKLGPARHANDQTRQHLQSSTATTQRNINIRYMPITSLSNMMPHHLKSSPARFPPAPPKPHEPNYALPVPAVFVFSSLFSFLPPLWSRSHSFYFSSISLPTPSHLPMVIDHHH
jgi:hypothetical protein